MIAAIGILLFLEASAQAMFGADFRRMQTPYAGIIEMGGVTLPSQRLLIIVAAVRADAGAAPVPDASTSPAPPSSRWRRTATARRWSASTPTALP